MHIVHTHAHTHTNEYKKILSLNVTGGLLSMSMSWVYNYTLILQNVTNGRNYKCIKYQLPQNVLFKNISCTSKSYKGEKKHFCPLC